MALSTRQSIIFMFYSLFTFENIKRVLFNFIFICLLTGSESPTTPFPLSAGAEETLPNELSAPYEVPQFPIEQIEKKLAIQRQLNVK